MNTMIITTNGTLMSIAYQEGDTEFVAAIPKAMLTQLVASETPATITVKDGEEAVYQD